jgi:arsenite oxidase small subunit
VTISDTASAAGEASGGRTAPYPVVDVARLADLAPGTTVSFNYPDASSPALLMRLAASATDGVGDDESVVAFSILCTHKGCPVSYKSEHGMLVCPCHWSTFDPARGGSLVIGQASESLPRVQLQVKDGMVQAVGMDGLIYGRHTNIL